MNILITGGAGFIGTNCVIGFMKQSYKTAITIVDNFSRKGISHNVRFIAKQYPHITIIKADIANIPAYKRELARADVIIHLAGQTAVTTSITDPATDFETNVIGGFRLLDAVRTRNPKAIFIYASTNKVYGNLSGHPLVLNKKKRQYENVAHPHGVTEYEPLSFISPYGCSKGAIDQYVHDYSHMFGLSTIVFRQSCIYGEHQMGVEDQGWVAHFSKQILQNKPITIYGNGFQVRDLLYADDLVNAYQLSINAIQRTQGKIFNIGGGENQSFSLQQIISLLKRLHKSTAPVRYREYRPGDQQWYVSDTSAFAAITGWKPHIEIREGLTRLTTWQSQLKHT